MTIVVPIVTDRQSGEYHLLKKFALLPTCAAIAASIDHVPKVEDLCLHHVLNSDFTRQHEQSGTAALDDTESANHHSG